MHASSIVSSTHIPTLQDRSRKSPADRNHELPAEEDGAPQGDRRQSPAADRTPEVQALFTVDVLVMVPRWALLSGTAAQDLEI